LLDDIAFGFWQMSLKQIPQKLYKYRAFDINSLKLLVDGEAYYSDPCNFNDPLDCNPEIEFDVDKNSLESLFHKLKMESQIEAWEQGIAQAGLRFNTESEKLILKRMRGNANSRLEDIKDYANYHDDCKYKTELKYNIEELLKSHMGINGVLSLSEIPNCPLMEPLRG
jgi:hypothetical protein